jgi:hypothetical protein
MRAASRQWPRRPASLMIGHADERRSVKVSEVKRVRARAHRTLICYGRFFVKKRDDNGARFSLEVRARERTNGHDALCVMTIWGPNLGPLL